MEGTQTQVLWGAVGLVATLLGLVAILLLYATWRNRRSPSPVTALLRSLQAAIRRKDGGWKASRPEATDLTKEVGEFSFCTKDGALRCKFRSELVGSGPVQLLIAKLTIEQRGARLELVFHHGQLSSMKLDGSSFRIEDMEMRSNDALAVILLKDVRRAVGFPVEPDLPQPAKSYSKNAKKLAEEKARKSEDSRNNRKKR